MKACTIVTILGFAATAFADCYQFDKVEITFYGWPDNDPPSADTAYNCGGRNYIAGGSGTYDDPLSMASAEGEFSQCEIVYVPYLRKYVRYEDYCQECTDDYKGSGKRHIDIWTGSSTSGGGQNQIDCEDNLTPDGSSNVIVRSPASTYAVDTTQLYQSGSCATSDVFSNADAGAYC